MPTIIAALRAGRVGGGAKGPVAAARGAGGPELGALAVGSDAAGAVFGLEEGEFGCVDSGRARRSGTRRLRCHMTVRAGEVVWDLNGLSRPAWETQGEYVRLD